MHLLLAFLLSVTLQGPVKAARTVTITVDNTMKYSVDEIKASPGETLRIVVKSVSTLPKLAMAHNVVVLAPGTDAAAFVKAGMNNRETDFIPPAQKTKVVTATPLAGPNETVEVTFKVPGRAGTYEFICTFPGHYTLGMKGVLTVR